MSAKVTHVKTAESASSKTMKESAIVKRATLERTAKLVGSWKQNSFIMNISFIE